ncbi:hypothetical protein [Streptosporangium sp. NPDC049644]|uniref:hypothetical protein n=1 Tax=Streptosporangium sp. NPDC049644 TaxID=3155507 RepID=UPI00342975BB
MRRRALGDDQAFLSRSDRQAAYAIRSYPRSGPLRAQVPEALSMTRRAADTGGPGNQERPRRSGEGRSVGRLVGVIVHRPAGGFACRAAWAVAI